MKRITLILATIAMLCASCSKSTPGAYFKSFSYKGNDICFQHEFNPDSSFQNPVLAGFFPDPSVCRKGDDYFLVNSTFSYFPGVPIHHSKDLVHWEQIGYVLDRTSQLQLDSAHIAWGVYAPDIQYNENNDTFYMVNTIVMGINNFFVKTKDPFAGNWSDPIKLPELDGIDPSFFFDDDGKAYIVYNGDPLEGNKYDGHRAIKMYEFDLENDKVIGECIQLLSAGIHPSENPQWIEGPHIYKHDGKYFLMAAEGGTGTQHSEVILISDNVKGPYKPAPKNPVLTQRTLPEDRSDKVTSTGHADLIWTQNGECWAFFLGCRPYDDDNYNTGRETFLVPVDWSQGYPVILPDGEAVPAVLNRPNLPLFESKDYPKNGNFEWTVDLAKDKMDYRWLGLRIPAEYSQSAKGLKLEPREWKIYQEFTNPSLLGVRQQHLNCEASVDMDFTPETVGEIAGLAVFQNENANFVIGEQLFEDGLKYVLYDKDQLVASEPADKGPVTLKIVANGPAYDFYYTAKGKAETKLGTLDGHKLSTHNAGGFTGAVFAMYTAK